MKNVYAILLLVITPFFFAGSQPASAQSVKMEPHVTQSKNPDGTTTRSVFQNNVLSEKIILDSQGRPLEVQEFEDGNVILTRKIVYGGNGAPIKTQVWDEDRFLIAEEGHDDAGILRIKKTYRIDGKIKAETRYNEQGVPVVTHHYKYDKKDLNQREWKTTEHRADGTYTEITYTDDGALWEVTDYDRSGIRVKSAWFNWDGTRTETLYDETGRPLHSERKNDQGAPVGVTRHEMEGEDGYF